MCDSLRPDLVLMVIFLTGEMDGVEAACVIQRECNIPVILPQAHTDKSRSSGPKRTAPYGLRAQARGRGLAAHGAVEVALFKHRTEQELRRSEQRYPASLLGHAQRLPAAVPRAGPGRARRLPGPGGQPGLRTVSALATMRVGRLLTEVFSGHRALLGETLCETARTGRSVRFENFLSARNMYYLAQAIQPGAGPGGRGLEDVTER